MWRQGKVCRGPWRWTTARWTFPRKRRDACPATPRWCRCVMTPTARCSTSAQDPHGAALDPPRAPGARPQLPVPGLHGPPLRRASRGALGRWRRDQPRQPGAAMPTPSPGGPRGRIRSEAARDGTTTSCGRMGSVLDAAPATAGRHARGSAPPCARARRHPGVGRHALHLAYAIDVLYTPRTSLAVDSASA